VYWIGDTKSSDLAVYDATDGNVLTSIDVHDESGQLALTADRRFLLVSGRGTITRLRTVNTHTNVRVDDGIHDAHDVSVCDDGTIISVGFDAGLVTYSINDAGHLEELSAVDAGQIRTAVCSPDSTFVVASMLSVREISSFAIGTSSIVQSLSVRTPAWSMAFNPATTDLFVLQSNGELSVYAFDTNTGMFGALQASVDTGGRYSSNELYSVLQFAYGKLFVHANDQLLVFDAEVDLLSSDPIISGYKAAICISEGVMCC
jgi:hypothetical protein